MLFLLKWLYHTEKTVFCSIRRRRSSERPRFLADRELLCDEGEGNLSHITPPMVNDQGMSSIGDCAELGDGGVVFLHPVSSRGRRPPGRIVLLPPNEAKRATLGGLVVDLVLRSGGEGGGPPLANHPSAIRG